jgi:hypothetical protein
VVENNGRTEPSGLVSLAFLDPYETLPVQRTDAPNSIRGGRGARVCADAAGPVIAMHAATVVHAASTAARTLTWEAP